MRSRRISRPPVRSRGACLAIALLTVCAIGAHAEPDEKDEIRHTDTPPMMDVIERSRRAAREAKVDEEPELDFVSPPSFAKHRRSKLEPPSDYTEHAMHDAHGHKQMRKSGKKEKKKWRQRGHKRVSSGAQSLSKQHREKEWHETQNESAGVLLEQRNALKSGATSVELEEEKVKVATLKLVKWLRNRLRKRLNEIADLETSMTTAEHAIANLAESQKRATQERKHEISEKRARQTALAEFRRTTYTPDAQLRIVRDQSGKLERQLVELGHVYEKLAAKQLEMEAQLRDAGFSHWLDARGNAYMPETAVGVLAKSAEVLGPVASGIGSAVAVEQELAREVDALLLLEEGSVVPGVVSDVLVLAPLIPIVALAGRLSCSMQGLSVLHYIVYLSAVFAAQAFICFLSSLALSDEAISHFQRTNEPALIAVLFLTAGLYTWYVFLHALLAVVYTTRRNIAHLALVNAIGYAFYHLVFQPAVLNRRAGLPVVAPAALGVVFLFLMTERNDVLRLDIPLQKELRATFDCARAWAEETVEAMGVALLGGGNGDVDYSDSDAATYERDAARHRHHTAYHGASGMRPLAMGTSRSSAVSNATTAYFRRYR